jgi:Sigma-70, region 4
LSTLSKQQSPQLDWRRSKVLELSAQGYSEREISETLKVSDSAVHRDLVFIRQQARENLQKHIDERIPEEYEKCIAGMNTVLKMTSHIANTVADPRTKLQALSLMNDCYKYKMDLTTGGVIVTDAIKFVQINKEKLTTSKKEDEKESEEPDYNEDIDQLEEEQEKKTGETEQETTTNQVF